MSTPAVRDAGCCANFYNTLAVNVNKAGGYAKSAYASAGETLGKIWNAVSAFFVMAAQKIGQWLTIAKDGIALGFNRAKDWVSTLPKEGQIALLGATVIGAATALFCCGKKAEANKGDTTKVTETTTDTTGKTTKTEAEINVK